MNRNDFPKIHFYDQDFVDIYNKTWSMLGKAWLNPTTGEISSSGYFFSPGDEEYTIDQFETIFSSFFLVYSNRNFDSCSNLDYLYNKQERDGAIRCRYNAKTDEPIYDKNNPEGLSLPLFAWAEFNLYHKSADKRRIKDVMSTLERYVSWLEGKYKAENGLFAAPTIASGMVNSPREGCVFPVDFNACMAINAAYMSALGDILNDKELSFKYKRMYFSLKTRINSMMWDSEDKFYHDLDQDCNRLPEKTIAGFWPLLAEIPNADRADELIEHLNNPETFGTDHPVPTLSASSAHFKKNGEGYCGSVFPAFNFMIIKGLEKYQRYELARECAIRHLYFVLEAFMPADPKQKGDLYEAYQPCQQGVATWSRHTSFPRTQYLQGAALSTIALMIENVIGLNISLPRKTVDWVIPNLEIMGIENLSLKRNLITIVSNRTQRGWEIQMESEKLYYFTINIIDQKKKTLPIPSGKCSMLIDKL